MVRLCITATSARPLAAASTLAIVLVPTAALALPTPDALIGVVNLVPWIAGAVVSATAAAYALLRRRFGERSEVAAAVLLASVVVVIFAIVLGASHWSSERREVEVDNLAMYLRCDLSAHESYAAGHTPTATRDDPWSRFGNFSQISLAEVAGNLERRPDAVLLATERMQIQYESGIPAVRVDGELRAFDYARRLELPRRLAGIAARDLYLVGFSPYGRDPGSYPTLTPLFARFDNVYLIHSGSIHARDRYVRAPDGSLRPADMQRVIDWPVRDEGWLFDTKRVRFPGITELLTDEELAAYLRDDEVLLVLPFSSFWRSADVYRKTYLSPLLAGIRRSRILPIDLHADDTTATLDRYARLVDGRRFVVAGLTKYDYIYNGLDVTFGLWERLGHDRSRFRFEGFSARLPEAVAHNWVDDRDGGVATVLAGPFWGAVERIAESLALSMAAAVLVFAVVLRTVLFPIGFLDTRSRMLRARVARLAASSQRPSWSAAAPALLRRMGARVEWEVAGALVTLALLLPAYRLLAGPTSRVLDDGFLWMVRLGEPDLAAALIVSALVAVKLAIGGGRRWVAVCATLAFVPLLLTVPAAVLVYAAGVLAATTCQDLVAARSCRRSMRRALLKS